MTDSWTDRITTETSIIPHPSGRIEIFGAVLTLLGGLAMIGGGLLFAWSAVSFDPTASGFWWYRKWGLFALGLGTVAVMFGLLVWMAEAIPRTGYAPGLAAAAGTLLHAVMYPERPPLDALPYGQVPIPPILFGAGVATFLVVISDLSADKGDEVTPASTDDDDADVSEEDVPRADPAESNEELLERLDDIEAAIASLTHLLTTTEETSDPTPRSDDWEPSARREPPGPQFDSQASRESPWPSDNRAAEEFEQQSPSAILHAQEALTIKVVLVLLCFGIILAIALFFAS